MTVAGVARDDSTAEFFDGTASGVYLIRRCVQNGHASKPQAEMCSVCGSQDLRWEAASGNAKLVSWAVVPGRQNEPEAEGVAPEPTIVAIGELAEGPWMWARLLGADPGGLCDGMALRIAFEQPAGSEAIPVLVPAAT
ncbi:MAG TPA: OB-fold domain-containing protein [Acidimicrobiales bacterium]|nr:OB-fold domain-containing protein [Acidimicrobiales bacterium]